MAVTRYNSKDCVVMVDGVYITGLAEDMVSGSKDEDLIAASVGGQGDVVKNVVNNPLGQVTITIQATSPQRAFLMSLKNRTDEYPVTVNNAVLGESFGGQQASLLSMPELSEGTEVGELEFVFQVFDYDVK